MAHCLSFKTDPVHGGWLIMSQVDAEEPEAPSITSSPSSSVADMLADHTQVYFEEDITKLYRNFHGNHKCRVKMPTHFPIVLLPSTLKRAKRDAQMDPNATRASSSTPSRRNSISGSSPASVDSLGRTRASKRKPLEELTPPAEMGPPAAKRQKTVVFTGLPQASAISFEEYVHAERERVGEREI